MPGGVRAATAIGGLLLLLLFAAHLPADDVLLSLPREFDVTAQRPLWGEVPADIEQPPALIFRFRGGRFHATTRWTYHSGTHVREEVFEGTLQRGRLEGTYEAFAQVSYAEPPTASAGCTPLPGGVHSKEWSPGRIRGTATPEGLVSLTLEVTSHRAVSRKRERDYDTAGCYRDLGWVDVTRESETEWAAKWKPYTETIVLQLPVGELQSSQEPATPPPVREPRSAAGVAPPVPGGADPAAGDAGVDSGRGAVPDAPSGGTGKTTDPRVGAFEGAGGRSEESPWSVPVTPGEAAGAAAAVALTSLLGALWMFGTSGLSPGDFLGSAPEVEALEPPSAEAPPREVYVEGHRDGEVRPETGEVWSESVGGWVGENYHELERRQQAEVRRAQGASDRESRRESARVAEELRASREREAAAARRGAEAADAAVRLEAVTVEPYQPGWTDHTTTALEWAEWGTDTSVSVLGRLTGPAGERGAEVYTVAKETLKGLSEGVADYARGRGGHVASEGSAWVILERGTIGASKGVAKVGLDRLAGKLMDGVADKLAGPTATVLTDVGDTVVTTVTRELRARAVTEVRRSTGVELARAVVGSELQAPVKAGIEGLTGEKM